MLSNNNSTLGVIDQKPESFHQNNSTHLEFLNIEKIITDQYNNQTNMKLKNINQHIIPTPKLMHRNNSFNFDNQDSPLRRLNMSHDSLVVMRNLVVNEQQENQIEYIIGDGGVDGDGNDQFSPNKYLFVNNPHGDKKREYDNEYSMNNYSNYDEKNCLL